MYYDNEKLIQIQTWYIKYYMYLYAVIYRC